MREPWLRIVSGLIALVAVRASFGFDDHVFVVTSGVNLGTTSSFFMVVGNDGAGTEGSYGRDSTGLERPEDAGDPTCVLMQNLDRACDR